MALALDLIAGELLQSADAEPFERASYRPSLLQWYARRIDDARLGFGSTTTPRSFARWYWPARSG